MSTDQARRARATVDVFSLVVMLHRKIHARRMEQVNDTNPAAGPSNNILRSLRTEARALIALGWVPSPDEPWRIYPLRRDTFSTLATRKAWSAMHEVLTEPRSESRSRQ